MVSRVLEKTGTVVRARKILYRAVAQTVLLYRSKIWEIRGEMINLLEAVHHWIMGRISGKVARCICEEGWECPPPEEAIDTAGMWPREYVKRWKARIAENIAKHPIYKNFTRAKRTTGPVEA